MNGEEQPVPTLELVNPLITAEERERLVWVPSSGDPQQAPKTVDATGGLIIVGANGAGKTRLGAWLEFVGPQKEDVVRIAAQRSLVFPPSVSPKGLLSAQTAFYWAERPANWDEATWEGNKRSLRVQARYGGSLHNAEVMPLDDYSRLVTLLFSENYANLLNHESLQRTTGVLSPIPDSSLRQVQETWESLLPHRKLEFASGEVRVQPREGGKEYSAISLSDGERVMFYLIGQVICARTDALIIIDEPEIHLHRAIQKPLWDALERQRPDCTFMYLTHDLEFASDRPLATKVWLSNYDGQAFVWQQLQPTADIPEAIYLEVLGSRRPVLFVEGTQGSLDVQIYQAAFPDLTVRAIGGCASVVAATKSFNANNFLHHHQCSGFVDRDYLTEGQIKAYAADHVQVPDVAEIENIFLTAEVVRCVARQLLLDEQSVLTKVQTFVRETFERQLDAHCLALTRHELTLSLGRFSSDAEDPAALATAWSAYTTTVNPEALYKKFRTEAQQLLTASDYDGILRTFNYKGLCRQVERFFGLTSGGQYVEKVLRMAKLADVKMIAALRAHLPLPASI